MTVGEAQAAMAEHYAAHACSNEWHEAGCVVAQDNYVRFLTALAEEKGLHPQSFPGVRSWMRAHGQEPIPMEEAWAQGRAT